MNLFIPPGEHRQGTIIVDAVSGDALTISLGDDATADIAVMIGGNIQQFEYQMNVDIGSRGQCSVVTLQHLSSKSDVKLKQQGEVGSEATLTWCDVTLGGAKVTHDLLSRVVGEGGTSAVEWVFYGKGSEHYDLSVRNQFDAPSGGGEVLMKGVAEQKAHAGAKGLIGIGLRGNGTQTYLTQEVLMLDPSAKIDAIPGLEIKTNDVKASHSATVSRVSPEGLFYFASRGIPKDEARAMYIQGFLGDLLGRIADASIREKALTLLEAKYRSS